MRGLILSLCCLLAAGPASALDGATRVQMARGDRAPDVIFVPTPQVVVEDMLRLANVQKGDVLYDLGSGDGRIPVTAARLYGVRAVGVDYAASQHARGIAMIDCKAHDQERDPLFTGHVDWTVLEGNVAYGGKEGDGHGIYLSNGGDWNIVRARNDIRNWTGNQKNSGCLPHERAWLSGMIADDCHDGLIARPEHGWRDGFRAIYAILKYNLFQ